MRIAGSVVAATLLAAAPLGAQDTPLPRAGAFFVNVATSGSQVSPDIAADGAESYQVVWQTSTGDPVHQDVRIRKILPSLAQLGEEPLAQSTALDQREPRIAMELDGDWVAIWTSEPGEGEDKVPISRLTSAGGTVVEDELELTNGEATDIVGPDVAWVGTENFVGAWRGLFNESTANLRGVEGKDFGVSEVAITGVTGSVAVAAIGDDDWVIAWQAPDVSGLGVHLRCFEGEVKTMEAILPYTATGGPQSRPDLASLGGGAFVAVWRNNGSIVGRFFVRREDGSCAPHGPQFEVSTPDEPSTEPSVAAAADGAFVVAWSESTLDADGGIAAREFRHDGAPIGEPFAVHPPFAGPQSDPAVAVSASTFAVVWSHADDGVPVERDIAARSFHRRLAFSDGFESGSLARWSDTQP
jgi:hypothetical protein